jgi:hypothetical protein
MQPRGVSIRCVLRVGEQPHVQQAWRGGPVMPRVWCRFFYGMKLSLKARLCLSFVEVCVQLRAVGSSHMRPRDPSVVSLSLYLSGASLGRIALVGCQFIFPPRPTTVRQTGRRFTSNPRMVLTAGAPTEHQLILQPGLPLAISWSSSRDFTSGAHGHWPARTPGILCLSRQQKATQAP